MCSCFGTRTRPGYTLPLHVARVANRWNASHTTSSTKRVSGKTSLRKGSARDEVLGELTELTLLRFHAADDSQVHEKAKERRGRKVQAETRNLMALLLVLRRRTAENLIAV